MNVRFKTPFGEVGIVHYTKFHNDLYENVLYLGNTFITGFYKIDPDMGEVPVQLDEIDELCIDWNGDTTSVLVTYNGKLCKAKFQHNFKDIYVKIEEQIRQEVVIINNIVATSYKLKTHKNTQTL